MLYTLELFIIFYWFAIIKLYYQTVVVVGWVVFLFFPACDFSKCIIVYVAKHFPFPGNTLNF